MLGRSIGHPLREGEEDFFRHVLMMIHRALFCIPYFESLEQGNAVLEKWDGFHPNDQPGLAERRAPE